MCLPGTREQTGVQGWKSFSESMSRSAREALIGAGVFEVFLNNYLIKCLMALLMRSHESMYVKC